LPYLDPGLPLELLPKRWRGEAAEEIFDTIDFNMRDAAQAYAARRIAEQHTSTWMADYLAA
jgi:phenylacetic acid degradation operon negative regulatory protein